MAKKIYEEDSNIKECPKCHRKKTFTTYKGYNEKFYWQCLVCGYIKPDKN